MTSPALRFCTQCGSLLNPTARFCGACGQAVLSAAPAGGAQPSAVPAGVAPTTAEGRAAVEPVVGVIPGLTRSKGLLGSQSFCLVATPERLAFVTITQQMMNEAVRQANAEAKRQGKGWAGQIAAQMQWLTIIGEHYRGVAVADALSEHPDNFSVPVSQIRKVQFQDDADDAMMGYGLVIEGGPGKLQFTVKGGPRTSESRRMLQQVLGSIVR
jgi:hypothetical protein